MPNTLDRVTLSITCRDRSAPAGRHGGRRCRILDDVTVRGLVLATLLVVVLACAPATSSGPPSTGTTAAEPAAVLGPAPPDCGAELPGFTRHTVAVHGVVLHVALGGPPTAPPVVLLHGFPETWRTWSGVAGDLAADHRVVLPDLRGVGCSSFAPAATPDAYDKRSMAADLAALVDALRLAPATVVGHDMGAMTAFAWARARPDQVARLGLSGGGVPGYGLTELGPPHLATFAAPPGQVARSVAGREREFLTRFVASPAVERSGALDDAVRAYSRPGRLDAALGQYRALARDAADNRADPRPLPMPVLALSGGAPDISAATVAALAPRLSVTVVPEAGHYVQQERPRAVAAEIRAFAAGV